ncbi:MAG TPA: hypothetical protein VH417_19085 [Vicinamibacterales bacterium]|jgi:hypothetical protein
MTSRRSPLIVGLLAAAALGLSAAAGAPARADDEWRSFKGSWSASGRRDTMPIENDGVASLVHLSGAVVLTANGGLTSGFRGEVIGFDDGSRGTGRAVWTDARGDRIFSAIAGEPLGAGRRVTATITGGTGRYRGIAGDYSLTWQYVVDADDAAVQGRSADLTGRFRLAEGAR